MKLLVTGAMGYVGSWLIPFLLADGHEVVGYDIGWFGDGFLPKDNPMYRPVVADIRDRWMMEGALAGCEAVIHLACVSNDYSCQLDEALSTSINFDAFEPLVQMAKASGVRRFIYCSSSSVYGVSHAPDVTEDHPLVPLTLYNKYKGLCEPQLLAHQSRDFEPVVIRPATVCGYAPRQRFDLTVNIMTNYAVRKGAITVFGGQQLRPNLHIQDMVDCYRLLLTAPAEKVAGETFNVGRQNMKVADIAELVARVVTEEGFPRPSITTEESQDTRSYHINSEKIARVLGFTPQRGVEDAVRDLCHKFAAGAFPDSLTNPWYVNVKQLMTKGHGVDMGQLGKAAKLLAP